MKTENLSNKDLSIPLETLETVEKSIDPISLEKIRNSPTKTKEISNPVLPIQDSNIKNIIQKSENQEDSTFSCRESIHIEDLEKAEDIEITPKKNEEETKIEVQEENKANIDEEKGIRNKFYVLLEYFLGFVLGLTFNLLSYTILSYMSKKERKRKGIFIGCMVSFGLIFLICLSYMSYTRQTLIAERQWANEHSSFKGLHIPSFWKYLTGQVGNHYKIEPRHKKKSRSLYNKRGSLLTSKNKKRKKKQKSRKSVPIQLSRAERRRRERERLIESLNRSAIEYQKHLKELL